VTFSSVISMSKRCKRTVKDWRFSLMKTCISEITKATLLKAMGNTTGQVALTTVASLCPACGMEKANGICSTGICIKVST